MNIHKKRKNKWRDSINNQANGITLIALVVTIVVLLILAGITIQLVFNNGGMLNQAQNAKLKTEVANAREKLEVILASAQIEKQINQKYNQDDFLDLYILDKIKDGEVLDNIVIVDNYAFELDRSVPKIGEYLSKKEELVFPKVEISTPVLDESSKLARFTVTAIEKNTGINKIEIWFAGEKIETITKCYDNVKTEITENYEVDRNGIYTVKVYANITGRARTIVKGIVSAVEFFPNGNVEWKKSHTTKIAVTETTDKVKSIKYQWLNTTTEPAESTFIENCSNQQAISGKGFTGTYYLWTLLETQSGRKYINRSEAFNFDNEGPEIQEFNYQPKTATTYSLVCKANDEESGIAKYEVYAENKCIAQYETSETLYETVEFNEVKDIIPGYEVRVYDTCGNCTSSRITNSQEIMIWKKYELIEEISYEVVFRSGGNNDATEMYYKFPEWSLTPEIIETEDGWDLKDKQKGYWVNLIKAGTSVYAKYKETGEVIWFVGGSLGEYDSVWCNYAVPTKKETIEKGDFICFENYLKSQENPTEGKYNGKYYEMTGYTGRTVTNINP